MPGLRHVGYLAVGDFRRDHARHRRRRGHVRRPGDQQRRHLQLAQARLRDLVLQRLPDDGPDQRLVFQLHPSLDAFGVGGTVRRPKLAKFGRHGVPALRPDEGGGLGDLAVAHAEGVRGNREAVEALRMGERIVRGDAAAGGGGHQVKFPHAQKFHEIV